MFASTVFRRLIQLVYSLSPYMWFDTIMARLEKRATDNPKQRDRIRQQRYVASELYITIWLILSVGLFWASPHLPSFVGYLLLLRALGILNKELGVVVFGTCKITESTRISATDRVITLVLTNFTTALFCFATAYALLGNFNDIPSVPDGDLALWALRQSAQLQFTLSGHFEPNDAFTHAIALLHSGFCFLFSTLIISLFVSLLSVESEKT